MKYGKFRNKCHILALVTNSNFSYRVLTKNMKIEQPTYVACCKTKNWRWKERIYILFTCCYIVYLSGGHSVTPFFHHFSNYKMPYLCPILSDLHDFFSRLHHFARTYFSNTIYKCKERVK